MDYMQIIDYIPLLSVCAPIVAVAICGILKITKSKDDSEEYDHNVLTQSSDSCKSYTMSPSTSEKCCNGNSNSRRRNRRKSRSTSKRQETKNNKKLIQITSNKERICSSEISIKNWLQNDVHYYEQEFISSCAEENMASCYTSIDRSSTSSNAAGNDDSHSTSSNENLCSSYTVSKNLPKKEMKSKQKRQYKNKKQLTSVVHANGQSLDFCAESNGRVKSNGAKQTATNGAYNLRKQCTKAAALKAALNNSKISNPCYLDFNSSVRGSLSAASSTSSTNSSVSSSASNSPTNSVRSSPESSPTASKRNNSITLLLPLRQFSKLNMNEEELAKQLERYIIDPSLLRVYGFPVESVHYEHCVEIYKCLPKHLAEEAVTMDNQRHHSHFYGRKKYDTINTYGATQWYSPGTVDSGLGSGESSPRFTDSDSSEMGEEITIAPLMAFYTPDGVLQIFSEYCNSLDKQCVRCSKMFRVNADGEYLSLDSCTYHSGKLNSVYNGKCYINTYSCCQGEELSGGCCQHELHVWNGVVEGINGPYNDFVYTRRVQKKQRKHAKVYAIDCEMSYTGLGLEVTKVTVVNYIGLPVYEHFVKPKAKVVDYNTRFSGVSEKDFSADSKNSIKTFDEVQKDLFNLFDADTILIGHALDNDLRALRLVHNTIVDTSLIFSHSTGYPYRRSLKNLTQSFLKRDIQCGDMGHSSFEDSRACLELMMWKIRKDLRHWN